MLKKFTWLKLFINIGSEDKNDIIDNLNDFIITFPLFITLLNNIKEKLITKVNKKPIL